MEKKAILQIARLYSPHIGGVEKHVEALSSVMLQHGVDVSLITEKYESSLPSHEVVKGVSVYRISYPKIKIIGILCLWLKIMFHFRLILRSNLIQIHDVYIWYLPFRLLFFWKKCFFTIHGWEGRYPVSKISLLQKKLANKLSSSTLLIGSYLRVLYGINAKHVIFGFVENLGVESGLLKKKTITFLGRLERDTGIELFLEYLKNYRIVEKYEVVFCGDGSYASQCKKYGKVTGFVDPKKYLAVSEYLIASGYLSVFEGMKFKCKVLVLATSDVRKLIFRGVPFKRYISVCSNTNEIDHSISSKTFDVESSFRWTSKYDLGFLYATYAKMWGNSFNK